MDFFDIFVPIKPIRPILLKCPGFYAKFEYKQRGGDGIGTQKPGETAGDRDLYRPGGKNRQTVPICLGAQGAGRT